ncbi:MAG: ATP synthase F0 subunit B [Marinilabiliales bacterium]|nr:MAG: ATP synthase F0 subunit B [Marinilabiliales bacterium]
MSLINPGFGLVIWMTIALLVVLFVLKKYAWKPIMESLKEREEGIDKSLRAAEEAHEEMKNLKIDNEKLLKEAKEERDAILREGRKIKDKMIEDAKLKANEEASNIVESAKDRIEHEKKAAIVEIKNVIADQAITIAEKILREEFKDKAKQKDYINTLLKETNLN